MLGTVYLAHWLFRVCALLIDILGPFETVQQVVAQCFIEIERDARNDFAQEGRRFPDSEGRKSGQLESKPSGRRDDGMNRREAGAHGVRSWDFLVDSTYTR